jgi:hypothetical protein
LRKSLRGIFFALSVLIIILFIIFVVNQTFQVVNLASRVHPAFGTGLLWFLVIVYTALIVLPLWMLIKMPRALRPPEKDTGEEYEDYLRRLSARLKKNSDLKDIPLSNPIDIEKAIKILDKKSTGIIRETASTVFVATAISQSGRLDAFMVLLALAQMVWKVSRVYYQRPNLSEMVQLYANVAGTTFIASELDDVDISRQVEPIVGSVLGASISSAIPGVHMAAMVVTNSLLVGAANAFLILRVGAITKKYCGSLVRMERKKVRTLATVEAARLLSLVVVNMAGTVTKTIMNAAVKKPGKFSRDLIKNTWQKIAKKENISPEESLDF